MTKYLLPVVFCLIAGMSYGQQASFSSNASFMLNASFHGKADGTWIQKVTQVKFMILDKDKAEDVKEWGRLARGLQDQRFEELVSIRKGKDRVRLVSRNGDGVKEVTFMAGDGDGGLFIQFAGKFNERDMEQMQLSIRDNN